MSVEIVAVTQPVGKIKDILPSEFIAYVARVSNPSNQNNTLTSDKLLKYLATHKHFSPFEMCDVVMEINTTRDIARQILRHRSFVFQEYSQRYADPTQLGIISNREARLQDHKNRQNSIETDDFGLQLEWEAMQISVAGDAFRAYEWAIEKGIAKEVARAVLPEGLTASRMYMKGSIRSWIHYVSVRTDPSAQKEHRILAQQCWNAILEYFPALESIIITQIEE